MLTWIYATTAFRGAVGLLERGFAAFVKVPYHDASTRREMTRLLDYLDAYRR